MTALSYNNKNKTIQQSLGPVSIGFGGCFSIHVRCGQTALQYFRVTRNTFICFACEIDVIIESNYSWIFYAVMQHNKYTDNNLEYYR